jgi:three-Cys-motif partner protein
VRTVTPKPLPSDFAVCQSPQRVVELEQLRITNGDSRRIIVRRGDCARYLRDKVARNPAIDWRKNRAVVFLDPFGMQVHWGTISALAKTKAVEIFLNFPVGMAIQRPFRRRGDLVGPCASPVFGSPRLTENA